MPVPKKRQSKSQKNSRRFNWKEKASKQSSKALSKAKLIINKLQDNKLQDKEKTLENDNN